MSQREVALWILELANAHDEIDALPAITALNEDRSVAGFPPISDLQSVEAELQARRQYYRQAIKRALDRLPASSLVQVLTIAVGEGTDGGEHQAPILIDDLVDSFEVDAQEFLGAETKNIDVLVQRVRNVAERDEGRAHIEGLVTQLEKVVKNWARVVQPIHVSARSRGTSHRLSHKVAAEIRRLAVDLFNEHGLLDISKRLTALQQEVFAEVDRVVEQAEEDASALDEIAEQRMMVLAEMEARADKVWSERKTPKEPSQTQEPAAQTKNATNSKTATDTGLTNSFRRSNQAVGIGLFLLIVGIIDTNTGGVWLGLTFLLGALAYQSRKRVALGLNRRSRTRAVLEGTGLLPAILAPLVDSQWIVYTVWILVAYAVAALAAMPSRTKES